MADPVPPTLSTAEYIGLRRELLMRWVRKEISRDDYQMQLSELDELFRLAQAGKGGTGAGGSGPPAGAAGGGGGGAADRTVPLASERPAFSPESWTSVAAPAPRPVVERSVSGAVAAAGSQLPGAEPGRGAGGRGGIKPTASPREWAGSGPVSAGSSGVDLGEIRSRLANMSEKFRSLSRPASSQEPRRAFEVGAGGGLLGFQIVTRLQSDRLGTVYRARASDGAEVCLRVFGDALLGHDREIGRLYEALEGLRKFEHPHVARVLDFREDAAAGPVLVTEYFDGKPLDAFVAGWRDKHGEPGIREVLSWLGPVGEALEHLHKLRLVHRDIMPQSILVNGEGFAKLVNFGLAGQVHSVVQNVSLVAEHHHVEQAHPYMAPEQWAGHMADASSDQYAFAAVVYEVLAGRPPFLGELASELEAAHRLAPVPVMPRFNSLVNAVFWLDEPRRGERFALAKKRIDRFSSVGEFLSALRARQPTGADAAEQIRHQSPVIAVAGIGDGAVFATADRDARLVLWDLDSGQPIKGLRSRGAAAEQLIDGNDGRTVIVGTRGGELVRIDLTGPKVIQTAGVMSEAVSVLSLWPDHLLAVAGAGGQVRVVTEEAFGEFCVLHRQGWPVSSLAWSHHGLLAVGEAGGGIEVYHAESGELRQRLDAAHAGAVTALCFSREARTLVSAGRDGCIHAWSLAGRHRMHTFIEGAQVAIEQASRSQDNSMGAFEVGYAVCLAAIPRTDRFMAVLTDGSVHVFELYRKTVVGQPVSGSAATSSACYLPQKAMALLGERSGPIRRVPMDWAVR